MQFFSTNVSWLGVITNSAESLFNYLFISILNLFYDLGNDVAISIDKEDF